jgi:tetratricopeptide (TPR) repeat protein
MKNEPAISTSKDSITVITNALVATQYLFKKRYPNAKVKVVYSGIKGYGSLKWDYAIFSCLFVPREVLLFGWPPYGTIYSEKLDGQSLMVVMKHADHDDENAMKAMQQLQWGKADSLFTAYLSKNPTNYGLYPPAVLAKYNLNKANEGILLAQRASVAIANDALLRYYTGLCWWSKGNPKNAIQEMNAAIQLKCQDLTVYQNLARVYEQSGDKANAQKTLAAFSARK